MHRQIWRAAVPLLLLAAVCGALWPFRRFMTAEAISRASPKQMWLAAGFLLVLYGVKSVSFCFPMSALTAAGGLLFPYPAALAVNLTGTAVAQTLPFLLGRRNRQRAAALLTRFPKVERLLAGEQDHAGLLVFLLRLAGGVSGGSGQSGAGSGGDSTLPLSAAGTAGRGTPGSGSHAAGRRPLGPVEPAVLGFGGDQRRHYRFVSHHLASVQLPALRSAALKTNQPGTAMPFRAG